MKLKKVNKFPHQIMLGEEKPCVSIYMPTHKRSNDWKQDRTRFRNLISKVEKSLLKDMKNTEIEIFLKPVYDALDDPYFWNKVEDSIGILLNEKEAVYYTMNRDVEEFSLVSDSFYIKPLIRNFQSYDKYHVLGLSREEFKLYEGTRYSIEEIVLDEDTITKKEDLFEDDGRGKVLSFGTYTGSSKSFHGHNTKSEEVQKETREFFRYVDDFINTNYTLIEDIPLILISLSENQGEFRSISKNKNLLEEGINKSITSIDEVSIKEDIWSVIEPIYLNKTKDILERFKLSQSKSEASIDPLEIAHGCSDGRVDTLIIESDRVLKNYYNEQTRSLEDLEEGDLINQLAIMTFIQSGDVVVLPKERFPEDSGCIAIFRY